jgi:hypothetical protein
MAEVFFPKEKTPLNLQANKADPVNALTTNQLPDDVTLASEINGIRPPNPILDWA